MACDDNWSQFDLETSTIQSLQLSPLLVGGREFRQKSQRRAPTVGRGIKCGADLREIPRPRAAACVRAYRYTDSVALNWGTWERFRSQQNNHKRNLLIEILSTALISLSKPTNQRATSTRSNRVSAKPLNLQPPHFQPGTPKLPALAFWGRNDYLSSRQYICPEVGILMLFSDAFINRYL